MLTWFKKECDFYNDVREKMLLSLNDGFRAVYLLDVLNAQTMRTEPENGHFKNDNIYEYFHYLLNWDVSVLKFLFSLLHKAGFIDISPSIDKPQIITPLDWDRTQNVNLLIKRKEQNKNRVKKWREKQKNLIGCNALHAHYESITPLMETSEKTGKNDVSGNALHTHYESISNGHDTRPDVDKDVDNTSLSTTIRKDCVFFKGTKYPLIKKGKKTFLLFNIYEIPFTDGLLNITDFKNLNYGDYLKLTQIEIAVNGKLKKIRLKGKK